MPAPCGVPPVRLLLLAALKDAGPQPQPDEPYDTRISDPMRHHPQQPLVVDRVEEAANVGIEHPVHALAHDRRMQCIKRHVRITTRPKAIGEPAKVGLADGTQHLGDRALDNLVLQRRHPEWPLPAIGFGNIDPPHRLRPVASGVDSFAEIAEVILQPLFVPRHCHPIDPSTRLPFLSPKRPI